jgi:hypothetical protein
MSALSSPTPVERTAIRTGYAALHSASSPNSEVVEQIVFALGAAGLLLSPESAAAMDKALEDLTGARLSLWEEEQENARLRLALASAQRGRRELRELVRQMRDALSGYDCPPPGETPMQLVTRVSVAWSEAEQRIAELEAERHSTNDALAEVTVAQRAAARPAILDLPPDPRTRRLVAELRAAAAEVTS